MMTSAQVVETSVNVTNNSSSWDYSHPDDQTTQTNVQLLVISFCSLSWCKGLPYPLCNFNKMVVVIHQNTSSLSCCKPFWIKLIYNLFICTICTHVVFLGKMLNSPSASQVHKWEPANCFGDKLTKCWGVTFDGLVSHPGEWKTPSRFILEIPEISTGTDEPS